MVCHVTSPTSAREPLAGRARVRAADVAVAAGVSISTVSLVVNGKWEGRVAHETVARVRAEVGRLGYVVDESARRLATGGAAAVAVVTPAFTNPFYARVSLGAAAALGEAFQVVFSVPEVGDDPTATLERLRGLRLAGALVAAPSPELLQVLARDLPTVVLDAPGTAAGRPRVDLDVADGAAQLARHLIDLDHRRVAFMRATPETGTFRVRHAALAARLAEEGATLVEVDRLVSDVDAGAAHAAALASMPAVLGSGVTAVVCATDLHAYGFLRACAERGVAVPTHMSVAGFDDQPLSAYVSPALTTVAFPADELGRVAGRLLAELIARASDADPSGEHPGPPARVLPVSLVVRGSTGRASR
jgi:LacI family transcriptional regulator